MKTDVLYRLLQDGGVNVHSQISAGDRDIIPIMNKITSLCTFDLAKLMLEVDGETPPIDLVA